jgi:hypothetical protein
MWIGLLASAPLSLGLSMYIGLQLSDWAQGIGGWQVKFNLLMASPMLLMAMTVLLWSLDTLARTHHQPRSAR